jgi:hypothetical protein
MNTCPGARLFAAAVICVWAAIATAQEKPASLPATETPAAPVVAPAAESPPTPETAPASESAPAETVAPAAEATPTPKAIPATEAAPVQEATPAQETAPAQDAAPALEAAPAAGTGAPTELGATAAPGAKRIVVLPVEFTVYEKSVSGIEAVPGWSETAQFALGDAAAKMLQLDNRFEIVAMPTVEGETEQLLREHVELFKIIADNVTSLLQYGGKAWAEKKTNFDYTLGDGLAFLADSAQADYALIVAGAQVKQTGGSVFLQFLAAAGGVVMPGGGTFIVIGVVNLRTGDLAWFNWKVGGEVFGITGSDVRDPATAQAVVSKMFAEYPNSKLITFRPF